jgi:chemotaxis signal transduction protein
MAESASEHQTPAPRIGGVASRGVDTDMVDVATTDRIESVSLARVTDESTPLPQGVPHVAVQFAGVRCLLPLSELRGVLTEAPKVTRFPFSPPWMFGVFLFRAELLALVDPLPVLLGHGRHAAKVARSQLRLAREDSMHPPSGGVPPTILVGRGERSLGFRADGVFDVTFVPEVTYLRSPEALAESPESIDDRYIAAMCVSEPEHIVLPVLAVAPLLDDLLRLLSEEGRDG